MLHTKLFLLMALIGAVLLSACGTNQANPNGPVTVKVTLKEFTVESSVEEFKPGVRYHFVLKNEGQVAHEFMIMPVTMDGMGMSNLSGMSMEEKDSMALMMVPQEQLAPGATAQADYTFASIPQGNIEIVCTLPGHFEAGMHMPISVK